MKAFFIYRDGKPFGSPTGYTTKAGARKSLVGCDDWYKLLIPYESDYKNPSKEMIDSGIYEWSEYGWLFERSVWSRKVWTPYVKEHYEIVEKEYNINVN